MVICRHGHLNSWLYYIMVFCPMVFYRMANRRYVQLTSWSFVPVVKCPSPLELSVLRIHYPIIIRRSNILREEIETDISRIWKDFEGMIKIPFLFKSKKTTHKKCYLLTNNRLHFVTVTTFDIYPVLEIIDGDQLFVLVFFNWK